MTQGATCFDAAHIHLMRLAIDTCVCADEGVLTAMLGLRNKLSEAATSLPLSELCGTQIAIAEFTAGLVVNDADEVTCEIIEELRHLCRTHVHHPAADTSRLHNCILHSDNIRRQQAFRFSFLEPARSGETNEPF